MARQKEKRYEFSYILYTRNFHRKYFCFSFFWLKCYSISENLQVFLGYSKFYFTCSCGDVVYSANGFFAIFESLLCCKISHFGVSSYRDGFSSVQIFYLFPRSKIWNTYKDFSFSDEKFSE